MSEIRVFSGSSNPAFARAICARLGITMGSMECGTFSDGESYVSTYESVRGCDVFLIQSTCATGHKGEKGWRSVNDYLMELLIMIDAMKRSSARRITAVLPYFGYARQDRKTKPRDPISAKLVCDLLTQAGANHVLTMDIHCLQIQGFFDIPMDNLQGSPLFVRYFREKFGDMKDVMVVSPDIGSVARVRAFAQRLNVPIAIVDKRRPKANSSEVMNIIGTVEGKHVILLDDMVDTAGSLCGAAKALMGCGGAKSVSACATHGILSGPAIQRLEASCLDELVLLDTIVPLDKRPNCVRYISAADSFAEAISRMHDNTSMYTIYDQLWERTHR